MSYSYQLLLLRTVTPLHVGCGHDVGVVDLPVIRERTTGHPFVPGSGMRGPLRSRFRDGAGEDRTGKLFGPLAESVGSDEARFAGSVAVHDARLLLFPVRSVREVFVWLTCPGVLRRLASEQDVFRPEGSLPPPGWQEPPALGDDEVLAPEGLAEAGVLYLEEYAYKVIEGHEAERKALAEWAGKMGQRGGLGEAASRTVLVSDTAFRTFAAQATVVQQHNRLTLQKTVKDGALFSLEALPPECLLWGFVGATTSRWTKAERSGDEESGGTKEAAPGDAKRMPAAEILDELRRTIVGDPTIPATSIHLGGGESTGLGLTRLFWGGETHAG